MFSLFKGIFGRKKEKNVASKTNSSCKTVHSLDEKDICDDMSIVESINSIEQVAESEIIEEKTEVSECGESSETEEEISVAETQEEMPFFTESTELPEQEDEPETAEETDVPESVETEEEISVAETQEEMPFFTESTELSEQEDEPETIEETDVPESAETEEESLVAETQEETPFLTEPVELPEQENEPETAEETDVPESVETEEEISVAETQEETPFLTEPVELSEQEDEPETIEETDVPESAETEEENLVAETQEEMPFFTESTELPEQEDEPETIEEADVPESVEMEKSIGFKINTESKNKSITNLSLSVEKPPLSVRSRNCLLRAGIFTLEQFLALDREKLTDIKNLGEKSKKEIIAVLDDCSIASNEQKEVDSEDKSKETTISEPKKKKLVKNNELRLTNKTSIEDLKPYLSIRATNVLMRNGVTTIEMLLNATEEQFLKFRNLGVKTLEEITAFQEKISEMIVEETDIVESEMLKHTFEKFKETFDSEDRPKIEEIKLQCYSVGNEEDTEQELIEEWYRLPEVKDIMKDKIQSALNQEFVFGMRLPDIRELLPKEFPEEVFAEILHEVAQKDHGKRYVLKSVPLESFLLENDTRIKEGELEVVQMRLSGKTLEEIAKQQGLTRERIRQKQLKAIRKIKSFAAISNMVISETRFKPLFERYDFDKETFCVLTERSEKEYQFLSLIADKHEKKPIEEMFQEMQLPGWIKHNWDKYCRESLNSSYLCIAEDRDRLIEKSRRGILNYLIPKYCENDISFEDFVEQYQQFLANYGLEDDPKLCITETEKRSQENHIAGRNDILWKWGKRLRYYPIQANDYTELLEVLDLNQYHNIEISTLKLFRDHPDLMMQYDIRDEYELHNLLKKIGCEKDIPGMCCKKTPHIRFGEFDKLAMIKEYMFRLAPIQKEELADAISEAYGFKMDYIMGFFGCIDLYYKDGVYSVDHKEMTEEQLKLLSENLPDDFYYIDEIEHKFAKLFPTAEIELVNSFNLKRMGFVVNSTYVIRNYSSASDYFYTQLTQNDITDISEMTKRFSGIMMFNSTLAGLKNEYTIIEFEPYQLIHIRKLEKMGVGIPELKRYCDEAYAFTRNMTYFTVESLSKNGFISSLDTLGFDPWFYSSVLREDSRFSYKKMGGTVLFDTRCEKVSTENLILYILERQESIEVDDFLEKIKEKLNITLEKDNLIWRIQNAGLYYDNIMGKIYRDYHVYYEEIMSIDEEE